MIQKRVLVPERVRKIPPSGFSWIDRRFVRDRFITQLREPEVLLYLFLTTVSDAQGLSFWADPTGAKLLQLEERVVVGARDGLVQADLVAYRYPLYQVLSLPEA